MSSFVDIRTESFQLLTQFSTDLRLDAMPAARAVVQALEQSLIRARNADGGWPYHRGKTSRLEATCWALLALGERAVSPPVLENWPEADDLLLERRDGAPNYAFHALAVITLSALDVTHERGNGAMVGALQRVGGEALPPSTINRQDNSLRGWSWIAGTFSWVEPTAWCLLALKRAARAGVPVDSGRIGIAERLLVDRCCKSGGWNYGNSNMLGQDLRPFVPPTALALLAMGDRRALPEVERSIDFLERAAVTEISGTALSLAFIALSILGRPVSAVRDALLAQIPTTLAFGNQMAAAMSLYALRAEDGHEAFAL